MPCEFEEGSLGHKGAIYRISVLYTRAQLVSLIPYSHNLCLVLPSWSQEVLNLALSPSWSVPVCLTFADIFIRDEWAAASHFLSRPNTCRDVIDRGRARGESLTRKFELRPQFSATFNSAHVHLKWDLMRWHHISAFAGGSERSWQPEMPEFLQKEQRGGGLDKNLSNVGEKIVGMHESSGIGAYSAYSK